MIKYKHWEIHDIGNVLVVKNPLLQKENENTLYSRCWFDGDSMNCFIHAKYFSSVGIAKNEIRKFEKQ
jgi:hypothetical protein